MADIAAVVFCFSVEWYWASNLIGVCHTAIMESLRPSKLGVASESAHFLLACLLVGGIIHLDILLWEAVCLVLLEE